MMHRRLRAGLAPGLLPSIAVAGVFLAASASAARADRIDDYIARQLKARSIPGVSLAVVQSGRVVRTGGYGTASLELDVPASERTVYEIGSISKQFTAEAVMLLVEEGKIALDERARHYMPDLPEAWSAITVRQLLTHTAGLHDWEAAGGFSYTVDRTPAEFVAFVAKYPLDFAPGSQWSYTNSGFPILGMIIEKVTGQRFTSFVADRVFKPLGMTASLFKVNGDIVPNRADGYAMVDAKLRRGQPLRPQVIAPNGGIMSTVTDLARWMPAFFSGRLVKPGSVAAMLAPTPLAGGATVAHGFAWFLDAFNRHRIVIHWGTTIAGFGAVVCWFPDDDLGVIMTGNLDDGAFGVDAMARWIANEYVPGTAWTGLKPSTDNDAATSIALANMIHDIAAGRDPARLAANVRKQIGAEGRTRLGTLVPAQAGLVFLSEEPPTPYHFGVGADVTRIRRYRVRRDDRDIYFTFFLAKDGTVLRYTNVEDIR